MIKKYLSLFLFTLIIVLSVWSVDYLTLENVKSHKVLIATMINEHYAMAVIMFFLSCTIFINSPVPVAAIIKLLGGFFFGVYMGAVFNILATLLACLVGFSLSRYAFKDVFERFYYQRLKIIEQEIERNGFYYFLSLRLMLVIPYFMINVIAGISRISFIKFFGSTLLGVIPASLVYANGGNQLERINSLSELFDPVVLISLIAILLFSFIPLIFRLVKSHKNR